MAKNTKTTPTEEPKQQVPPTPDESSGYDWGQEGPTGFEGTRPEDFGIPFLSLMQKGSPEVDEDHPDHETRKIEGVKAGMIINTLTREIVYAKDETKPAQFIPIFHQKLFPEWKPKGQGGGFVQNHTSPIILTKCKRNEKNEDVLPNGNVIVTTSYFSGLLLVDGNTDVNHPDEAKRPIRCIIAMSSTQLKKARMWINMMDAIKINGKTPPMFSHIYDLTSTPESNDKGNWHGWKTEINRVLTMKDVMVISSAKQIAGEMINSKLLAAPAEEVAKETSEDEAAEQLARESDRRERKNG